MADPLPPLIPKPLGPPPSEHHDSPPFDNFAIGFGALLFGGTQLLSKSAPTLAGKVSENIFGPEIAAGAKHFKYPLPKAALLVAPAPIGFVPPQEYGLPSNYLAGFNKFVTFDVPSLGFLALPRSHILKTLPDNDPIVQAENYETQSRQQRRLILDIARTQTLEQVLDLYARTQAPGAQKVFFFPEDVAADLKGTVFSRVGQEQGEQLLEVAKAKGQAAPNALADLEPAVEVPSPFNQQPKFENFQPPSFQTTGDLFAQLQAAGVVRPLDAEPTNTLQQAAFALANDVVKQLASERADP